MDIGGILTRAAALYPRSTAVVGVEREGTYAELHERALCLGTALSARGLAPGDRVAILAWNQPEYLEAYFGAALAGLVLVPLNVRLAVPELLEVLRDAGVRALLAEVEFASAVAELQVQHADLASVLWIGEPRPAGVWGEAYEDALLSATRPIERVRPAGDAPAHLYYTSGTTGRPKGVVLTHRNVATHALAAIGELALSERDAWAHIAPMFHLADAWATFAITWVGGRHVMVPRFDARTALDVCAEERVTITNLVPTMLNLMVKDPTARGRDWSALRAVLSGGAPIAPEVVRQVIETFGCEYVQTYGMTETSPYLTLSLLKEHMRALPPAEQMAFRAKTGRPFAAVELRVVGEDGRDVPPDERTVGEIRVRGETVTPGYWNRPEETAAAFEDGWLKTGDLAVVDAEGFVTIVDRAKDMIITGGEKVYSTEVEHVLYAHPAVLEAAVFGVPDATWGESVRAAVVLRPDERADGREAELIAFCRERLAAYKCPRAVRFVDALPRTGSGKIAKRVLRAAGDEGSAHG